MFDVPIQYEIGSHCRSYYLVFFLRDSYYIVRYSKFACIHRTYFLFLLECYIFITNTLFVHLFCRHSIEKHPLFTFANQ